MLNRVGKDAIGRATNSRRRATIGRRPVVEGLEGRQMMTAGFNSIAAVSSPQYQGYQVPITGTTSHQQTFTVTSDNPGIKASVATGRFLTINVAHTAAAGSTTDISFSGAMTFQIFDDTTPITTQMITSLVEGTATNTNSNFTTGTDFYNGKVIHRIAPGFPNATDYIVQGGSVNGHGSGNVFNNPYPDEFSQSVAFTGTGQIALANSGADTNDSQFFITTGSPNSALSYHHTIFGQLVEGQTILTDLTKVATETDPTISGSTDQTYPISPVTITSATVTPTGPDGVIHLDTTVAPVGATGNVTVTATDVTDGTTSSQTFPVTVAAQTGTAPLRPFINQNYDKTLTVAPGQTTQIQIPTVSPTPGDTLTYTVQGGYNTSTGAFVPIDTTEITSASSDDNGVVTLKAAAGATGKTTLLIGVRDSTNRAGTSDANSPQNFEYHTLTVNFTGNTTAVAQRPLAQTQSIDATPGGVTAIQLTGTNPNATTTLPLTYAIATQPTHGTISGFDATTGALNYTPTAGYAGPDVINYTVTDPNSGQISYATAVSINVANATTGAVRFIANDGTTSTTTPGTLIVTPNPRTDGGTNTIVASVVNGVVQISVNGVVDALEPAVADVNRLVIYGSKANDNITVDSSLAAITTLDGGHGGKNVLKAGAGQTREHGWFGTNTLEQGSSNNFQLGRTGHDKFVKGTGTSDVIFEGVPGHFPRHLNRHRQLPTPTTGTYYKFGSNGKTLVKTTNPYHTLNKQERATRTAELKARESTGTSGTATGTANNGASSNQAGSISNGTSTGTTSSTTTAGTGTAPSNI